MMEFKGLLAAEFAAYRLLSQSQLDALEAHYHLLCKWNEKINLCRFRDVQEAVELHYCESLYLGLSLPVGVLRIADVGSGAGFPGYPIAVLRSECHVDLIESDGRKAAFLREASDGNGNICVLAMRAEDCKQRYDWVVSRAVRAEIVRQLALAPECALLTTDVSPIKVPWGRNRFIQMFHVKQRSF